MSAVLHGRGSEAIYLEVDGEMWRVHDCAHAAGKFKRLATPSARATYRIFVSEKGMRKAHKFTKGEIHELTPTRVEAQWRKAGYLGTDRAKTTGYGVFGGPAPSGGSI